MRLLKLVLVIVIKSLLRNQKNCLNSKNWLNLKKLLKTENLPNFNIKKTGQVF